MHWKLAASLVIKSIRSKRHYQENLSVAQVEHMSEVDCFDGEKMRREWGTPQAQKTKEEKSQDEAKFPHDRRGRTCCTSIRSWMGGSRTSPGLRFLGQREMTMDARGRKGM
jgi:hypothetical protein